MAGFYNRQRGAGIESDLVQRPAFPPAPFYASLREPVMWVTEIRGRAF